MSDKGSTLPDPFHAEEAMLALKNPKRFTGCFFWEDTPQGQAYWRARQRNGLDDEARATLEGWIAEAMVRQTPPGAFRVRVRRKEARSHTHGGW